MFDRAGIGISGIQEAVAPAARVLASARHAGIKIVYLKMRYRPDLSNLGSPDAPNRVRHLEMLAWSSGQDARWQGKARADPRYLGEQQGPAG